MYMFKYTPITTAVISVSTTKREPFKLRPYEWRLLAINSNTLIFSNRVPG